MVNDRCGKNVDREEHTSGSGHKKARGCVKAAIHPEFPNKLRMHTTRSKVDRSNPLTGPGPEPARRSRGRLDHCALPHVRYHCVKVARLHAHLGVAQESPRLANVAACFDVQLDA